MIRKMILSFAGAATLAIAGLGAASTAEAGYYHKPYVKHHVYKPYVHYKPFVYYKPHVVYKPYVYVKPFHYGWHKPHYGW